LFSLIFSLFSLIRSLLADWSCDRHRLVLQHLDLVLEQARPLGNLVRVGARDLVTEVVVGAPVPEDVHVHTSRLGRRSRRCRGRRRVTHLCIRHGCC